MIPGTTSKRIGRGLLTSYASPLTEERLDAVITGQEALEFAFLEVRPTQELVQRCYSTLDRHGLDPLPVSRPRVNRQ